MPAHDAILFRSEKAAPLFVSAGDGKFLALHDPSSDSTSGRPSIAWLIADLICKSLILRTMSDFAIHRTADIIGEADLHLSMIAIGRSKNARRKQRAMATATGGGPKGRH